MSGEANTTVEPDYPPDAVGAVSAAVERLAYSVPEVARAVGASRGWVQELVSQGVLPSTKVGGRRFVLRDDLLDLLRSGRTPQPVDG